MSKLALHGGEKTRTTDFPSWPVHDERDVAAVSAVVESGQWGGFPYPGPQTQDFLTGFTELHGGGYPVAMVNGTVTMEVALRAADIGWGDEVIVPAYTFHATASAPMAAGAIPVIVDIDPQTYCIDPKAVEAAITPKTKAIIPVHIAAQLSNMDAIMDIASRHNLIVIEDCAQTHGSKWGDKGIGTIGHFGSFSMQSTKILTTGEGGILICKTEEMAQKASSIIDCGRPHDPAEEMYTMGVNYRMTELQSALGNVALQRFPAQFAEREAMVAILDEALSDVPGVRVLQKHLKHTARAVYCYVFAIEPDAFGVDNKVFCQALYAEGIPCFPGYPPMNRYDLFQPQLSKLPVPSAFPEYFKFDEMYFPETERASVEGVWLGEHIFRVGVQGIDEVAQAIRKIHANAAELQN